jgi:hypothetical protein
METGSNLQLVVNVAREQIYWYVLSKEVGRPRRFVARGVFERGRDTSEDEPLLHLLLAASDAYRHAGR